MPISAINRVKRMTTARTRNFNDILRQAKKIRIDKNDNGPDFDAHIEITMKDGSIVFISLDDSSKSKTKIGWTYEDETGPPV
jgi:hypothetical protein